jgi:hypothetical protein
MGLSKQLISEGFQVQPAHWLGHVYVLLVFSLNVFKVLLQLTFYLSVLNFLF